ncbi:hypothetical protein ACQ86N_18995 [Puia sp. P3]|uniref:hypothetical protein n=1 Tax=Puia sp. P3 TaxID=3423952 RepID=UPI003D67C932
MLLRSSFDPAEIYKVAPDYTVVTDTQRSRIARKFLHVNSAGIFDCTPLFNYYVKPRNGVDTPFLNRLCSSETFVIMNDNEVAVRDNGNTWYYLNNSTAAVNKLPVVPGAETTHFFTLNGILCIFSEKGEWQFFEHGKETGRRVDKTVPALIGKARPWLKPMLGPGNDQVLVRAGNEIYELYFRNGELATRPIFQHLKVLDQLIATSFLFDRENRRLFIATLTSGFIIVTKKTFRTITFTSPIVSTTLSKPSSCFPMTGSLHRTGSWIGTTGTIFCLKKNSDPTATAFIRQGTNPSGFAGRNACTSMTAIFRKNYPWTAFC